MYSPPLKKKKKSGEKVLVYDSFKERVGRGGDLQRVVQKILRREQRLTAKFAFLGAVPRHHRLDFFAVTRLFP